MSWQDIPGWTCKDTLALYAELADTLDGDAKVVEVGVAYGRSFAFLVTVMRPSVNLFAVDVFKEHMGGQNLPPDVYARMKSYGTPGEAFSRNMELHINVKRGGFVTLHEESVKGAARFGDGEVDAVFIDADHLYLPCKADIEAWLPKVKPGGILAGHDYSPRHHPGVVSAVNEIFGQPSPFGKAQVNGVVWRHRVPAV